MTGNTCTIKHIPAIHAPSSTSTVELSVDSQFNHAVCIRTTCNVIESDDVLALQFAHLYAGGTVCVPGVCEDLFDR